MYSVGSDWNPKQQMLREALSGRGDIGKAIRFCLELHGVVHCSAVSGGTVQSYMDEIWDGMNRELFAAPIDNTNGFGRKATITWDIWHITRIEDITANILLAGDSQVLDEGWLERLDVRVTETGNAMSDAEIKVFSRSIDLPALREYRNAVGLKTRSIVSRLAQADIKRRFPRENLDRILREGGVTESEKSKWLLDFWGKKDVAGILMMPITRHQIVHLNECARIKEKEIKLHNRTVKNR